MGILPINYHRKELIEEVLNDLELLKNNIFLNQYAINENIAFFEATKSIFRYIWWLITRAPKIDGEKLLEINDLLPKWDLTMHRKLIEMEKKKFPGLIDPLVKRILETVLIGSEPMVLMNIGCGGMEVERQVISNLIVNNYANRLVFIGVDRSPTTAQLIKENFNDLFKEVEFYEVDNLDNQKLQETTEKQEKQFLILLCKNDIFQLDKYFQKNAFDVVFHVLFKHHINKEEKDTLDTILDKIGRNIVEYDGYLSWPHLVIPHTIVAWGDPVFLNASIFSDLRYFREKQLKLIYGIKRNWDVGFFRVGTYLAEYTKSK